MQQIISNFPDYGYDQSTIFYNMVGNFIPPEWQRLRDPSGKVLSKTSRQLLSLIVSCFESGDDHVGDELQESYYFFQAKLDVCQRRVRQCLVELQQAGFINVELLTIIKYHIKCRIPSIKLLKNFRNSCIENKYSNAKKFPAKMKDFSAEPERNFSQERKNFQPHNIIDNNISILESRSSKSSFVNFSEDDFSNTSNQEKIEQDQNKNDDKNQDPPQGNSPNWFSKVATKAKSFWGSRKKLAEFHPLSDDDAQVLRLQSGREFNLGFINKLLLKLAGKYPDHSFPSKKAALNYMIKALAYELRDANKVNNEGFMFKQDSVIKAREDYLQEVESNKDTSKSSQFRRKLAARLEPQLAYTLLTGCNFFDPQNGCYKLQLSKDIAIPQHVQDVLLKEAKAVYGGNLERLEIIPYTATIYQFANKQTTTAAEAVDNYAHLQGLDSASVWFKIRKCLIKNWGVNIDKAWFSKLELVDEDQINKKIVLKPQTSFIRDWINQNYQTALEQAFGLQDFSFEIT